MDILKWYNRNFSIEGIYIFDLENRLKENRPYVLPNGTIVIDNKDVIKCVGYYYSAPNKDKHLNKQSLTAPNYCYYVQQYFDLEDIFYYDCVDCHLACIKKLKENQIIFKIKDKNAKKCGNKLVDAIF